MLDGIHGHTLDAQKLKCVRSTRTNADLLAVLEDAPGHVAPVLLRHATGAGGIQSRCLASACPSALASEPWITMTSSCDVPRQRHRLPLQSLFPLCDLLHLPKVALRLPYTQPSRPNNLDRDNGSDSHRIILMNATRHRDGHSTHHGSKQRQTPLLLRSPRLGGCILMMEVQHENRNTDSWSMLGSLKHRGLNSNVG
jgi:hypothetical protein